MSRLTEPMLAGKSKRKVIWADFNAKNDREEVPLTCRGSMRDIELEKPERGELYWLTDGDLSVQARLYVDLKDRWFAVPVGQWHDGDAREKDFVAVPIKEGNLPF